MPRKPGTAFGELAPPVFSAPVAEPSPAGDPSAPLASSAPLAPSPPEPSASSGQLQIGDITTRGFLEADARGGVTRRLDRLQVCLTDPKNEQHGSLTLKIGIDASGSVAYSRATGGELSGTPLGDCLLRVFYKMGFAAPASNDASFTITLRAP